MQEPEKEVRVQDVPSVVISIPGGGATDNGGVSDLDVVDDSASRQSSKRIFFNLSQSMFTTESSKLNTSKSKRAKKKRTRLEVAEVEDPKAEDTPEDVYDEYEADPSDKPWTPPRPKVPPRASELPVPEKLKGKRAMKQLEKDRAAAAAAEAEKIRDRRQVMQSVECRKMNEDAFESINFFVSYAESGREKSSRREEERTRLMKEMLEEIRLEKHSAERQELLEKEQRATRKIQLEVTWYKVFENNRSFVDYSLENKEQDEWAQYMRCDGLPDPGVPSDLNTFMYLWSLEDEEVDMDTVAKKYEIVIYLLTKLENIIQFSIMNPPKYIDECKAIRQQFRDKLQSCLDLATYRLLRRIEGNMTRESLKDATYVKKSEKIICCVWALIRLPISIKQISERDKKAIEVVFEEMDMTIKMPMDIDCYCMAIRGTWVICDHYSDQGTSFNVPALPEERQTKKDLLTYCEHEYETKLMIRKDQAEGRRLRLEEKKAMVERMANPATVTLVKAEKKKQSKKATVLQYGRSKKPEPEPEPEPEPLPYLPTPEELVIMKEDEIRKDTRKLLFTRCEKTEVNLRKYRILGGVFHIDLIYQPPQPKDMRRNIFLTVLQLPKQLKFVPFSKSYEAPPQIQESERSPEVVEAEMKALEVAMEALALITLKLPDSVLWFEPPLVARWVPEQKIWSTQDIHDMKYNEEKQIITFRTGRLGAYGLAGYRFVNLPFQSWKLKPEMGKENGGGVTFSISAAIVQAEIIVREDLVCLYSLIGGTTAALQDLIGQYMKLHFLIQKMRSRGCDLFPDQDTYSYVKGLPMKHPVAQRHLETCIGLLCTAYLFAWSRWNATCTPRQIVLQLKELHGCVAKQQSNVTLLVTPLQTTVVQCTEVSSEFSDKPVEVDESKFYADVYNMALRNAGIKSRILMKKVSYKLATTVTKLLQSTNVISMSC